MAAGKACVILPDTASSARWETADRPFLEEAFTAAGVESDIQNANGDKAKFATIADGMIAGGCTRHGHRQPRQRDRLPPSSPRPTLPASRSSTTTA